MPLKYTTQDSKGNKGWIEQMPNSEFWWCGYSYPDGSGAKREWFPTESAVRKWVREKLLMLRRYEKERLTWIKE